MSSKNENQGEAKYGTLIDWLDIQLLEGKLLTYVDATYQDKEQREAQKSLVRNTVRDWMRSLENEYTPFSNLKVVAYFSNDTIRKVENLTAERYETNKISPVNN